jgi:uncharacterized protein YqkB
MEADKAGFDRQYLSQLRSVLINNWRHIFFRDGTRIYFNYIDKIH